MNRRENRPSGNAEAAPENPATKFTLDSNGFSPVAARSVSFWAVHEFVQRYLNTAGHYPMAGTPAWCELADGDRRKWAALLDFAQHHALRVETAQESQAEASKAVAASADWSQVGHPRSDAYIPRIKGAA